MKKTKTMHGTRVSSRVLVALLALAGVAGGCASGEEVLTPPDVLVSPYLPARSGVLLAVAPPTNESGASMVDTLAIGDGLVAAVSEARGLSAVPMNRTLAAMHSVGLTGIRTPAEARVLAGSLGVDGVIIPSITAYDPYDPPRIGLALALMMVEGPDTGMVDPAALSSAYTDRPRRARSTFADRPASTVMEHLDASNHEVLAELREYAKGRHDPASALTWRRYTASMELYTQFASYHAVRSLLETERSRVAPLASAEEEGKVQR